MVVIDCARAGAGPEAALLARLADATLLVSRQNGLYAPSLARSVDLLNSAHAAPIGIVVTR
jgi:Mrp family chromosome partitioning ATPase